jgi:hypothetical protein
MKFRVFPRTVKSPVNLTAAVKRNELVARLGFHIIEFAVVEALRDMDGVFED